MKIPGYTAFLHRIRTALLFSAVVFGVLLLFSYNEVSWNGAARSAITASVTGLLFVLVTGNSRNSTKN